jgi:septal ring factor EnvC (AmiA/AmiB activator)
MGAIQYWGYWGAKKMGFPQVQRTINMLRQELEASAEQHAALVQAQAGDSRKLTAALIATDQAKAELQVRVAEIQGLESLLQERSTIIDELRGRLERDVAAVRVRPNLYLF